MSIKRRECCQLSLAGLGLWVENGGEWADDCKGDCASVKRREGLQPASDGLRSLVGHVVNPSAGFIKSST